MRLRALSLGVALAVMAGITLTVTSAQTTPTTVDGLVSAAKVAAGVEWSGTFKRLCIPPPPAPTPAAPPAASATPPAPPPRENWYAEPAKVGDNLYWLGSKNHHSWALKGSQGIILIEAIYEYQVQESVVGGMRKLGLDASTVKYALMSHAHGDHDGGAAFLQDSISGMRLVYGAGDWDLVEKSTNRPGGKPKRDMVGTDGLKLSVGDASIQVVTMPGHTPGTLSYLFEFQDNGKPLRVAYVGGTAIPFNGTAAYYDQYIASSKKVAQAAADYGATVLLSNHTEFDNGYYKAHTAAFRKTATANPFDVGRDGVARYFSMVQSCATAAKLRAAAAKM